MCVNLLKGWILKHFVNCDEVGVEVMKKKKKKKDSEN